MPDEKANPVELPDAIPPNAPGGTPRGSLLVTQYIFIDGVILTFPYTIPGDAEREMIGLYMRVNNGNASLIPVSGPLGCRIDATDQNNNIELRFASHGPMVRDSWYVESFGNAPLMVILVSPEG